jgi:hypothetical protein
VLRDLHDFLLCLVAKWLPPTTHGFNSLSGEEQPISLPLLSGHNWIALSTSLNSGIARHDFLLCLVRELPPTIHSATLCCLARRQPIFTLLWSNWTQYQKSAFSSVLRDCTDFRSLVPVDYHRYPQCKSLSGGRRDFRHTLPLSGPWQIAINIDIAQRSVLRDLHDFLLCLVTQNELHYPQCNSLSQLAAIVFNITKYFVPPSKLDSPLSILGAHLDRGAAFRSCRCERKLPSKPDCGGSFDFHGETVPKLQLIGLVSWVFRCWFHFSSLGSLCVLGGSPLRNSMLYLSTVACIPFVVEALTSPGVEARPDSSWWKPFPKLQRSGWCLGCFVCPRFHFSALG